MAGGPDTLSRKDHRKFKSDAEFQMAPMIDVVFQLLIFFFCVTTFAKIQSEQGILLATALSAEKLERGERTIVVNVREDGAMFVSGREMTESELEEFLKKRVDEWGMDFDVVIRSDKDSRYGATKDVFRTCAQAGVVHVKLGVESREHEDKKEYLLDPYTNTYISAEEGMNTPTNPED